VVFALLIGVHRESATELSGAEPDNSALPV
jgi:hypothetical protein